MATNPLTWGLGPFQTCTITPLVRAADSSSSNESETDSMIFSNGKLLTLGFKVSPPTHNIYPGTTFYDGFKENFKHVVLSYQLVHERKGIILSKSISAKEIDIDDNDQLNLQQIDGQLFITVSSRFKVSPMHLQKKLTLVMSLEFFFTRLPYIQRAQNSRTYQVIPIAFYTFQNDFC